MGNEKKHKAGVFLEKLLIDHLDEILDVEGVDAVNFGPIDYAVSKNLRVGYSMGEEVKEAYRALVAKAQARGIGVLGPVVPPTKENLEQAII